MVCIQEIDGDDMITDYKVFLKILYKPREAFEAILKEGTKWQEGLVVWGLLSVVSLVIFGAFSKALQSYTYDMIPLDFGFGNKFIPLNIAGYFVLGIFGLIITAYITNYIAQKFFNGSGNFSETLGVLGYANILTVVQSVMSSLLLLWLAYQSMLVLAAAAEMKMLVPDFLMMAHLFMAISIVFVVWKIWIQSTAVSAVQEIVPWRGFVAVIVAIGVSGLIALGFSMVLKALGVSA